MDMTTALTIKAQVVGQSQITGLSGGLKKVEGQSRKTATAMGRLKGAAGGLTGALRTMLPLLGTAALASFAKGNLDTADSMSKLSQRTGIAAPELDKFRKVAELSDTSIKSLERAFPALTKNMDMAAQKGKGPAFEAFERLGVAVKNADGSLRSADSVMLDIADKLQGMADGSEKAALASAVFGTRIGSELIPMLNSGGDAVRNMSTSLTQDFADSAAAFNDRIENMQEKFGDLGLRLTEALLPALEALAGVVEGLMAAFSALPGPIQSVIAAFAGIAAAAVVFAPLVSAVAKLGPLLVALKPALIAIVGALTGGGGVLAAIAAVFTGPVGWIALAVAAGVAIYKFRDQIAAVFKVIGDIIKTVADLYMKIWIKPLLNTAKKIYKAITENWKKIFKVVSDVVKKAFNAYKRTFIDPVINTGKRIYSFFADTFRRVGDAIKAPIKAAMDFIKGIVNSVFRGIGNVINGFINNINRLISGANKISNAVGGPSMPTIPNVKMPQFAKGGVVNGPTVAMVGEGGEPEYIIPQSKMARAAANYLGGLRGSSVIPAFANGGVVGPGAGNTTVQVTTGPVMQQGGTNYVTMAQFEDGMRSVVNSVTKNRSYGARRFQGVS